MSYNKLLVDAVVIQELVQAGWKYGFWVLLPHQGRRKLSYSLLDLPNASNITIYLVFCDIFSLIQKNLTLLLNINHPCEVIAENYSLEVLVSFRLVQERMYKSTFRFDASKTIINADNFKFMEADWSISILLGHEEKFRFFFFVWWLLISLQISSSCIVCYLVVLAPVFNIDIASFGCIRLLSKLSLLEAFINEFKLTDFAIGTLADDLWVNVCLCCTFEKKLLIAKIVAQVRLVVWLRFEWRVPFKTSTLFKLCSQRRYWLACGLLPCSEGQSAIQSWEKVFSLLPDQVLLSCIHPKEADCAQVQSRDDQDFKVVLDQRDPLHTCAILNKPVLSIDCLRYEELIHDSVFDQSD